MVEKMDLSDLKDEVRACDAVLALARTDPMEEVVEYRDDLDFEHRVFMRRGEAVLKIFGAGGVLDG